jgi:sialate O-acetylesterase
MKLANLFCDNMVFQAEKPVRIFGTGKGRVIVELKGKTYTQTFNDDNWIMEMPAQEYGGPYEITICLESEKRTLKHIAFGDVFLCSGQSNMQFTIREEEGAKIVKTDEKIRYYYCDRLEKHEGLTSADGWNICYENAVEHWSALATHMAQEFRKKKDVFVGIIGCVQGASVIRSWLPAKCLDKDVYVPIEERHEDASIVNYTKWNADCVLYEKMFSTLTPFSFKAVVWYQGESDTTVAEGRVYTELLARLITSWREDLMDKSLPFIVVQICDYVKNDNEDWRCIQRAQKAVVEFVENVTVVVSSDVCEHSNIHPSNKEKLAEKIARNLD